MSETEQMVRDGLKWSSVEECINILKTARNRYEFAMLFDLNGFADDPSVPQVFKSLRRKIQ